MQELDNTSIVTKFQHTQFLFCLMLLDVLFEMKLFAKLSVFRNRYARIFPVKMRLVTLSSKGIGIFHIF